MQLCMDDLNKTMWCISPLLLVSSSYHCMIWQHSHLLPSAWRPLAHINYPDQWVLSSLTHHCRKDAYWLRFSTVKHHKFHKRKWRLAFFNLNKQACMKLYSFKQHSASHLFTDTLCVLYDPVNISNCCLVFTFTSLTRLNNILIINEL